ncbi:hypothetical protein [Cellulosimicrobium sp. CUA-896]|uniref:hypothetical protein n=1 Tax=Cellulosimicrobium sp. CUA-896 TaxID=1517881 RepID=UPI000B15F450
MTQEDWDHSYARTVMVFLNGDAIPETDRRGEPIVDDSFLLLLNAHSEELEFTVPPERYGESWDVVLDTDGTLDVGDALRPGDTVPVTGRSVIVLTRPPSS